MTFEKNLNHNKNNSKNIIIMGRIWILWKSENGQKDLHPLI